MVEMFAMAIACLMIITTVQRPEERIDTTTGFGNFKTFSDDIGRTFINKKNIDIIYISISNFYSLEQILGIVPSLKLTKQIAKSIAETMKQCKIKAEPYYLGDGQFSLVISGKYKSLTQETAEALNTLLKQDVTFNDMQINLVAYICTGSAPQDCDNKETLIAMSNSIRHSMPYTGEVVKVSDITDKNTNQLNKNLDSVIDKALADRKFKVHYQPIYSTNLKRFTSAEALIRLTDEQYGYISPEIFIPAAEKNGTINKIGDYVLEEVCRFIASDQFKNSGLEYIEVNLSVSQCMQPTLADRVLETLKKYGVKANQINLEITETATTYSQNIMEENLQKLCDAGITFSMDDYGTGYSNIRSLASLPFDIIKLDKSFVAKKSNLRMQLVLKNTINMLKELNMKILVEGIETKEMLDYFIELKCDYVQGFYFSKPLPENDFVNFVKKNNN
jgi:EAL domain-containing protein (putative c-di-GMP-specific phosphodiesterase class I)